MILIKEEFVGGEKYARAIKLGGDGAILLWLAMKNYCSAHADTEGFVPDEDLDGLKGAPRRPRKALQALIECGRRLPDGARGAGLVEAVEGGWRLHDYLDHAAAPEEIELRREKQRLKKQTHRENRRRELDALRRLAADLAAPGDTPGDTPGETPRDSGGQRGDSEGDTPGDTPRDSGGPVHRDAPAGARPPAYARAPAPARAAALPNPTQPNPTKKSGESDQQDPGCAEPELGHVEPCPEHRDFAAEHGLDLSEIIAELRGQPGAGRLTAGQIRAQLAAMLVAAAAPRQSMGAAE